MKNRILVEKRSCGCCGCYYQGLDEDINVLEEWLDDNKLCFKNLFGESLIIPRKREDAEKYYKQIKAVENLIKGYRELEGVVEKQKICINELENTYRICSKDYVVTKDRIREKIGELKETADEDNMDCFIKIRVLEELLEEDYE